jgi:hypothetical protein
MRRLVKKPIRKAAADKSVGVASAGIWSGWFRAENEVGGLFQQPAYRTVKTIVRLGRSKVHDAKNNERHVCGRRRDGESAVSCPKRTSFGPLSWTSD